MQEALELAFKAPTISSKLQEEGPESRPLNLPLRD